MRGDLIILISVAVVAFLLVALAVVLVVVLIVLPITKSIPLVSYNVPEPIVPVVRIPIFENGTLIQFTNAAFPGNNFYLAGFSGSVFTFATMYQATIAENHQWVVNSTKSESNDFEYTFTLSVYGYSLTSESNSQFQNFAPTMKSDPFQKFKLVIDNFDGSVLTGKISQNGLFLTANANLALAIPSGQSNQLWTLQTVS